LARFLDRDPQEPGNSLGRRSEMEEKNALIRHDDLTENWKKERKSLG